MVWKYSVSFPNQPDTRYWSLGRPRHLKTPDKWERSDYHVFLSVLGKKHLASDLIFLKISWRQDVLTHQVHMASKIYFGSKFYKFYTIFCTFYQLSSSSINGQLNSGYNNSINYDCRQLLSTGHKINVRTCHCHVFFDIPYDKLDSQRCKSNPKDSVKRRSGTTLEITSNAL